MLVMTSRMLAHNGSQGFDSKTMGMATIYLPFFVGGTLKGLPN